MANTNERAPGCTAGFVWQEMWDMDVRETYLMLDATFTPFGHLTHTNKYIFTVYAQNGGGVVRPTRVIDLDADSIYAAGIAACTYVALHYPQHRSNDND